MHISTYAHLANILHGPGRGLERESDEFKRRHGACVSLSICMYASVL